MTPSLRLRLGAAVVAATLLPLAACTPGGDRPSTSPTPTLQPSPPETSLERQQRLDFEAAEKSYRAFMEEYNKVTVQKGGALEATPVMRQNAAGKYLEFYVSEMRQQKQAGNKFSTGTSIGYVKRGPYSPQQLTLEVCEDGSKNTVTSPEGEVIDTGQIALRSLYVRLIEGRWKVWNGDERGTAQSCS